MKDFFVMLTSGDNYILEAFSIRGASNIAYRARKGDEEIIMIYDVELKEQMEE